MGMYVLKSCGSYLHEGRYDNALKFYCPYFNDLLGARMFESEEQMLSWLREHTNYQPWRLNEEHKGWMLVSYADEAAKLITKLLERMA